MDTILILLQSLSKSPSHRGQNNSNEGASGSESKDNENNESKVKEEGAGAHKTRDAAIDKVLEDIQSKLDAFTCKDTLEKAEIVHAYLPEWY